jgi:hypothetical protein
MWWDFSFLPSFYSHILPVMVGRIFTLLALVTVIIPMDYPRKVFAPMGNA